MVGERFGPYELDTLLGRGGMGEVYRAVDTRKNDRVVALKRLPAGLAEDVDFQRRFLREAELAARLRDPHVIPIHDYGEIDGRPYLDMRLVEGRDLAVRLRERERLGPAEAVGILTQAATALDAAHREGLVHRDVKPQNMLLQERDFLYLIDFGIAANLSSSRRNSSTIAGTAAYMAPERFTTGGDHRVDVYALGCVLFELLTGRPPFSGDLMQLAWAHGNAPRPRPSAVAAGVPAAFDDVVAAAMAVDPHARPSTAGDLAEAARRAVEAVDPVRPTSATAVGPEVTVGGTGSGRAALSGPARTVEDRSRPPGGPPAPLPATRVPGPPPFPPGGGWAPYGSGPPVAPPPRRARRRGPLVALAVGLSVVLAVAALVAVRLGPQLSVGAAPMLASIPLAGQINDVVASPDGSRVYASLEREIAIVDATRNVIESTIRVPDNPYHLAVSPDGRRLFAGTTAGPPLVIDTATGTVDTIDAAESDTVRVIGASVSPDGRYLAHDVREGGVRVVDLGTGAVVSETRMATGTEVLAMGADLRVYVLDGPGVTVVDGRSGVVGRQLDVGSDLAVSPDGRRVYAVAAGAVAVVDNDRQEVIDRLDVGTTPAALALTPDGSRLVAAGREPSRISVVDPTTDTTIGTWDPGVGASGLAVSPDGRRAYLISGPGEGLRVLALNP